MNLKQIFFIVLFFFFILTSGHVYAAAGDEYNERWTCLSPTVTWEDKSITAITATDPRAGAYFRYTHSSVLRVKGGTNNPLPNSDTYVIECIQIPTNLPMYDDVKREYGNTKEVCTTGNSTTDMYIWNNDRLKTVQKIFSWYDHCDHWGTTACSLLGYTPDGYYKMDVVTPNDLLTDTTKKHFIRTNAQGDFVTGSFVYSNVIIGGAERKFMAYNRVPKNAIIDVAGEGGQQQGKLEFDFESANKNCVKISWDPYGTVFDTQTLEPIPGASVTLYVKKDGGFRPINDTDVPGGFIQNPFVTKEDGYFSFIVPDGTYKLAISAPGYTFPTTQTTLQSNANIIYSDFYRGTEIVQQGAMVHKDVPVDAPTSTVTQKYPAKLIGLFQSVTPEGTTVIDGHVSHPFAKINAYCKKLDGTKGTLNTTLQADNRGQFQLIFKPKLCNENIGETYAIVEVEAIDLTKSLSVRNFFHKILAWIVDNKDVEAAYMPISYSFDPILNYVEGYAMDNTNASIPGATVGVYAIGDKNPLRTVKADSKGRFAFTSNQLPKGPYELKYQNTLGVSTSVSTTKFMAQNLSTIKKEKIDLYSEKLTPPPTPSPPTTTIQGSASSISSSVKSNPSLNRNISENSPFTASSKQSSPVEMQNTAIKNQIIIMIIIMVLIVGVGGMIALFMLKKQNTPTSF